MGDKETKTIHPAPLCRAHFFEQLRQSRLKAGIVCIGIFAARKIDEIGIAKLAGKPASPALTGAHLGIDSSGHSDLTHRRRNLWSPTRARRRPRRGVAPK